MKLVGELDEIIKSKHWYKDAYPNDNCIGDDPVHSRARVTSVGRLVGLLFNRNYAEEIYKKYKPDDIIELDLCLIDIISNVLKTNNIEKIGFVGDVFTDGDIGDQNSYDNDKSITKYKKKMVNGN